jgi:plasmid stabilization system protein ParE
MKILIRPEADDDLDGIFAWIAKDSPRAAGAMIQRIRARLDLLAATGFAELGRLGRVEGTREFIDGPFIIVYEVDKKRGELVVLGIFHTARDRESGREMR